MLIFSSARDAERVEVNLRGETRGQDHQPEPLYVTIPASDRQDRRFSRKESIPFDVLGRG